MRLAWCRNASWAWTVGYSIPATVSTTVAL
jgi:hypothetical protein